MYALILTGAMILNIRMRYIAILVCMAVPFTKCDWPCIFPKPCACNYNHKSADCSNKGLVEIPPITNLTGQWTILMDNNNLTRVPDGAFGNVTLANLDLSNNQISFFSDTALNVQTYSVIYQLHIDGNKLTEIPSVIGKFVGLFELFINGNPIPDYDVGIFKNISQHLYTLSMGSAQMENWPMAMNHLSKVGSLTITDLSFEALPADAFDYFDLYSLTISSTNLQALPLSLSNLTGLTELTLDGNKRLSADKFSSASFKGLSKLRSITFSNCEMVTLPHIFGDLSALTFIGVESVPIESIDALLLPVQTQKVMFQMNVTGTSLTQVPSMLSQLHNLQNLWLMDGKIKHIGDNDFAGMSNLFNLYLSGNPIQNVSEQAFRNLPDLMFLYLDNTSLTTVPKAIQHLRNLGSVDMSGTDITCTCADLGWMKTWPKHQDVSFQGSCTNIRMTLNDYVKLEVPKC